MRKKFLVVLLSLIFLLAAYPSGSTPSKPSSSPISNEALSPPTSSKPSNENRSPSKSELKALDLARQYCRAKFFDDYDLLIRATRLDPSYREYAEASAAYREAKISGGDPSEWYGKLLVFCGVLK